MPPAAISSQEQIQFWFATARLSVILQALNLDCAWQLLAEKEIANELAQRAREQEQSAASAKLLNANQAHTISGLLVRVQKLATAVTHAAERKSACR